MTKQSEEIMEILESFDLTRCARSAAELAGYDRKTVQRYIGLRDAGRDPMEHAPRACLIDPCREKVEELVERSNGKVRADVVHERLRALGYSGNERTTRRAVRKAKTTYRKGHRRTYRPWIPEPGMWLQFDWGWGPTVGMRQTYLFCAWLAWSRFRVVVPTWDRTLGSVLICLDRTLRAAGGVPTYALTDNERTVSMNRVAGLWVRHAEVVAFGRHYGLQIATCVAFDPESKGGSESTVRVAKADLVPTEANLLPAHPSFSALERACAEFCAQVNGREHREEPSPTRRGAARGTGSPARLAPGALPGGAGGNAPGRRRADHPVWRGALLHATRVGRRGGLVSRRRGRAGDCGPGRRRAAGNRRAVGSGAPAHPRGALPQPPQRARHPAAQTGGPE